MSMTKKDFVAIAAIIRHQHERASHAVASNPQVQDMVRRYASLRIAELAHSIAAHCGESNPQFRRAQFLTACGLDPSE